VRFKAYHGQHLIAFSRRRFNGVWDHKLPGLCTRLEGLFSTLKAALANASITNLIPCILVTTSC